jgi:hypothetical protein
MERTDSWSLSYDAPQGRLSLLIVVLFRRKWTVEMTFSKQGEEVGLQARVEVEAATEKKKRSPASAFL